MEMQITNHGMSFQAPIDKVDRRLSIYEALFVAVRQHNNDQNAYQLKLNNCKVSNNATGFRLVHFETLWFKLDPTKNRAFLNRQRLNGKKIKIDFKKLTGLKTGIDIKIVITEAKKKEVVLLDQKNVKYNRGFKLPTDDITLTGTVNVLNN